VSIDRVELERLLANRPAGNRSAMQAVRECYDDIGLMRERGLSWAEISELLCKLGVTARDNQPISPVTLRSAFFLVGNEERGGAQADDVDSDGALDRLDAIRRAAVAAGHGDGDDGRDGAAEDDLEPDAEPGDAGTAPSVEPAPATLPERELPERERPTTHGDTPEVDSAPSPTPSSHRDDTTNRLLKGDRMLGTIFVLNDRGGVGKTLLSHHLMATAMLEGLQLKVIEYEVNERLARLFGTDMVEHRRITQDFMNMMGSGDGFYEFWDMIGPELQRGGRLYDFGGNISQWFFNWAEVSGFDYYVGEGERLTFMVPVTVDLASLSTGMTTLERIAAIAPKAKRVLVENGNAGPFSQLDDSQYAKRKAEMVEREGLQVISMPPCSAPAWARLTGHRLDQVATMTREDLVKLGMTPPVASRSLIVIHEWLRGMRQSLSPYLHDAFRQTPGATGAKAGARQSAL
jgi:hypothetical protein